MFISYYASVICVWRIIRFLSINDAEDHQIILKNIVVEGYGQVFFKNVVISIYYSYTHM